MQGNSLQRIPFRQKSRNGCSVAVGAKNVQRCCKCVAKESEVGRAIWATLFKRKVCPQDHEPSLSPFRRRLSSTTYNEAWRPNGPPVNTFKVLAEAATAAIRRAGPQ